MGCRFPETLCEDSKIFLGRGSRHDIKRGISLGAKAPEDLERSYHTSLTKSALSIEMCCSFFPRRATPRPCRRPGRFRRCGEWSSRPVSLGVHAVLGSHALHRFGVAHQTSLQSFETMMSSSISLRFREAGGLIRLPVPYSDHCVAQAFPHGHPAVLLCRWQNSW